MQQFSNQEIAELKSRVDQIHELLASRGEAAAHPLLFDQLSYSIEVRRIRRSHFGDVDMSGPVWDMMLDLMFARANGRVLSASDLATGADVPLSSGLRMIAALESRDLIERAIDERDRRRTLVRLTEVGIERMVSYFESITAARHRRQTLAA